MSTHPISLSAALVSLCKNQISQAGQRYTPGIDPSAPNLRIATLTTAIDNVACSDSARARFQSVLDIFSEAWKRAKHHSQKSAEIEQLVDAAGTSLPTLMDHLRSRDAFASDKWIDQLSQIDNYLMEDFIHWQAEEAKLGSDDGSYSSERNTVRGNIEAIGGCLRVVRDELEYATSSSFKLLFEPVLLICGEWGTGKTHLLCDVIAVAVLCSSKDLLIIDQEKSTPTTARYWEKLVAGDRRVHGHRAVALLALNQISLGISADAVKRLQQARSHYNLFSHPGTFGLASRVALGQEGQVYAGGHFDIEKLAGYRIEVGERIGLCRVLPNLIENLIKRMRA